MAPIQVERISFKALRTNDGRTLVEHPLSIDRSGIAPSHILALSDSSITVQDKHQAIPTSPGGIIAEYDIMGIVGIIKLAYGRYLLAITARTLAATIQSHKIWRIKAGISIPVGSTMFPEKPASLDDHSLAKYLIDQELLASLLSTLNSGHIYYSNSYDLTHSLQHNFLAKSASKTTTVIDDRYYFNRYLQNPLIDNAMQNKADAAPWILKAIAGFVGSVDIELNSETTDQLDSPTFTPTTSPISSPNRIYTVVLVSRLNQRRVGTRYQSRGLDTNGNASNNVEMEQIIFNHDFLRYKAISSFVQIRGSAPAIWSQQVDMSYRPRMEISDLNSPGVWSSVKHHLIDLKNQYTAESIISGNKPDNGQVVCVNLLDDSGFEAPLTQIYESAVSRLNDPKVVYDSFPINKWCKNANYKSIDVLVDRLRLRLANNAWFVAEEIPTFMAPGTLRCTQLQTGLARVSCLDSLDRTNLTCSIFAMHMLAYQVQSISPDLPAVQVVASTGVAQTDVYDPVASIRTILNRCAPALTCLWADSGDAISLLYAGTRALKADVTRSGKRLPIKGPLDDGMNSLTRYYLNNLADGRKQDGYDLWTGKTKPDHIDRLVMSDGVRLVSRARNPLVPPNSIFASLIPSFLVKLVQPLYHLLREYLFKKLKQPRINAFSKKTGTISRHLDDQGTPTSIIGFVVVVIRAYCPKKIGSIVEFVIALLVAVYLVLFVKVFGIRGQLVVDRPKLLDDRSAIRSETERPKVDIVQAK
eukprot:jgi/Hompol1/5184/HPOL_001918-RA